MIATGDLVYVARACCEGSKQWIGITFVVLRVGPPALDRRAACQFCDRPAEPPLLAYKDDVAAFALWRLKKIPPIEELTGEDMFARKPTKENA